MRNIYDHIDDIKVRPGMFIGDKKIRSLRNYLGGYRSCLFEKGIHENEKPDFNLFDDWVANHYWYSESTSWWTNMILDHSKDEEEALKTFFILLEKFKNE